MLSSASCQSCSHSCIFAKRSYNFTLKIVAYSLKVMLISAPTYYNCATVGMSKLTVCRNMHPLADKILTKSSYGKMSPAAYLIMGKHCTSSILNISFSWLFSGITLALEIWAEATAWPELARRRGFLNVLSLDLALQLSASATAELIWRPLKILPLAGSSKSPSPRVISGDAACLASSEWYRWMHCQEHSLGVTLG